MIPEQHRERLIYPTPCKPKLVELVGKLLNTMEIHGHGMFVLRDGGKRTAQRQRELYAIGRTTELGRKPVTNCDGVKKRSFHQTGRAADCAFRVPKGGDPFDKSHPWDLYGHEARKLGLVWGGNFKNVDGPHVQLK